MYSLKLRDMIKEGLNHPAENQKDVREEWTVVEMTRRLSRTTLDIIGLAGFSYSFGALDNKDNKLANAFEALMLPPKLTSINIILMVLVNFVPFLAHLPTQHARNVKAARASMESEGRKLLDIRKQWAESGELEEKKDLMSVLVKANLNTANRKDRMLDVELMGQIATFVRSELNILELVFADGQS